MDTKIASMAFLPERSWQKARDSIAKQVDHIYCYNGDWDIENKIGDANKFRGVIEREGYLFTIDDDLIYPEDYVSYMIDKIEQYNRKAVITLHGKIITRQPISSFYGGYFIKFRCLDEVKQDVPVHIPGTGVMAWHSDTVQFSLDDLPKPNMADIWAGIKCEKQGVPRICVGHEAGWLGHIGHESDLYRQNRKRDDVLIEAINSIQWREL